MNKKRVQMNKRGAYFFVIDALIAASIIFISLIIIFTTHSTKPETSPSLRMIEEYTYFLMETKIREFQGDYVKSLENDGNITSLDNTLLEQLTEFFYLNESKIKNTSIIMANFTREISHGIIPDQRYLAVYLNHTLIYNRTNPARTINDSSLALTTKKITFKRINQTYIYGPIILEVKIWV